MDGMSKKEKLAEALKDPKKQQLLEEYYGNDKKGVKRVCNKVIKKFASLRNREWNEIESLAGWIFLDILPEFDESKGDFEGYFYSCLYKKFESYLTERTRSKRCTKIRDEDGKEKIIEDESLDTTLRNVDGDVKLESRFESKSNTEREVFNKEEYLNPVFEIFLKRLSKPQRKIISMKVEGYSSEEIQEELHMTALRFHQNIAEIRSHENIKILMEVKNLWNY